MTKLKRIGLLLLIIILTACQTVNEEPVVQTPDSIDPTPTTSVEPTTQPTTTRPPAATDEPTITLEPTAGPESADEPGIELDPFTLADQILRQTTLPNPPGWQIERCEGEAPVLCVSDEQDNVGFVELLLYPLSGYDDDHPVQLAAQTLPTDIAALSDEQHEAVNEAVVALAGDYLDSIEADRAITFPEDTFTRLDQKEVLFGGLPALAFGFEQVNEAGEVVNRYLNVAAFDQDFIYWTAINYDPANVSTFNSDTAVTDFAPTFYELAANLAVHKTTQATLPALIPAISLSGFFPTYLDWTVTAVSQ